MFGVINPAVKNILPQSNEWKGVQTYTSLLLGSTPSNQIYLRNANAATAASTVQASPSIKLRGSAWASSPALSSTIDFDEFVLPITGTTNPVNGLLRKRYSQNNGAAVTIEDTYALDPAGSAGNAKRIFNGIYEISANISSTVGTLQHLLFTNPSGSKSNIGFKFGSTIKSAFGIDASGTIDYRGLMHTFFIGSTAESSSQIVQIYGGGIYNNGASYNTGAVTGGQADTGASVSLSTYGGFAGKGVLTTSATYTFGNELVEYVDGDSAFECSGTATACNTYLSSGTCTPHALAGCSWFAGNDCATFNGNQSGCEGQSPCVWETSSCHAYDTDQTTCQSTSGCTWNSTDCSSFATDQSTCETGHNSMCTWNFSSCSDFNSQSQGTCEGNPGCSWTGADCHAFDGTDESTCTTGHTGCSWDGSLCNGVYDEASTCAGQYNTSCTGTFTECTGSFPTGNCTGTYGAACQGTASCGNLTDDGETLCELESGCTWVSGATYTLPVSSIANRGNTSRIYKVKNIGASANVNVVAGAGDTLESSISLSPGDAVELHHYSKSAFCSPFSTEGTCFANTGCSWTFKSCSDFAADESTCNGASGCSWDGSNCTGTYSGTDGTCSGTYFVSKKWYKIGSF